MTNNPTLDVINVLAKSLDELMRSIEVAKATLIKVDTLDPTHLIERLNTYVDMVHKQRSWLGTLSELIRKNNLADAAVMIERINCMSQMIRDDARELVLMSKHHPESGM